MELNEKRFALSCKDASRKLLKKTPFFCCLGGDCRYSRDCAESISQSGKFYFDEVRKKRCDLTSVWIIRLEVTNPPSQLPDPR